MKNTCIRVYADVNQINRCKSQLNEVQQTFTSIGKVLGLVGNEVRLKILYLLHNEDQMCPCDISDVLGMTVPAISQHLRKLKDAGVVADKKVGQTIFYSIRKENDDILNPIFNLITEPQTKNI